MAAQQAHPEAIVEVWAQDEHRVGLKPILRRVWARKGQRPRAVVHPRYEWLYLYGFVHPTTGKTVWLILPTVNSAVYSLALAEFAREVGAGIGKQILLVVDQAGWHISGKVQLPEGIQLVLLPPSSPELQPAERLWPLTNEPLANRFFADLDALEETLIRRCRALLDMPEVIRAHADYHWWPLA